MMKTDLTVIGAGPAGLAAAHAAREAGVKDILVVERDVEAGGILTQCIHSGFGLRYFKEELTGPEYAERFKTMTEGAGIRFLFDTMALSVSPISRAPDTRVLVEDENSDGRSPARSVKVEVLNCADGLQAIETKAVVLAMGCRERTRPAIAIPGTRPSGVMTAGLAQRYINIEGKMVGRRAVILGSGDIGLIMARRMVLEGAEVLACVEIMPHSGGLARNIAQCLDDYDIPLLLSHTVTDIRGRERLTGVTVARVDEKLQPIPGTEVDYDCDTLLLSVGLIPENELSTGAGISLDPKTKGPVVYDNNETEVSGIFACGNVVQVHDLVDFVTEEAERAGKAAAEYILSQREDSKKEVALTNGANVSYTVPQKVRPSGDGIVDVHFRVRNPIQKADIVVKSGGKEICRLSREHLSPGEMEQVVLAKSMIDDDVEVSVEVSG